MSLIDSMQTLKDDIKSGRQKRRQDLKNIKQTTRDLQQDTHRMITEEERKRKEEAEVERRQLAAFTKDLEQDVEVLRKGFRRDQKELRDEILTAAAVWHGKATVSVKEEKKEKKQKEKKEEEKS